MPRQDLRDPRGARRASAARGTCSATRASAPTPTCTRSATRFRPWTDAKAIADGPSILQLRPGHGERVRHRRAHPLPPPRRARPSGRPTTRAGRSTSSAPTRGETVAADLRASCSCAAATTATTRATRRTSPAPSASAGAIVHPQDWPEDLDYAGKRVVVIGSGATAVTLVPAMAETRRARDDARSARPATSSRCRRGPDRQAPAHGCFRPRLAYPIVRWKNVLLTMAIFQLSRRRPAVVEGAAPQGRRAAAAGRLRHRHALHAELQPVGPAAVPGARRRSVRGAQRRQRVGRHRHIDTFTETGMRLASGDELEADIIVTATGLKLLCSAASRSPSTARTSSFPTLTYKGMMLSGVPNFAFASATRTPRGRSSATSPASTSAGCSTTWTSTATRSCMPAQPRPVGHRAPLIDFSSGYVQRAIDTVPEAGAEGAVAAVPELRARPLAAQIRPDRGRALEFSKPESACRGRPAGCRRGHN